MSHHILLKTNSRLGANKFPFGGRRELAHKALSNIVIFCAGTVLFEQSRKNSRRHGNNRVCPAGRVVQRGSADLCCRSRSSPRRSPPGPFVCAAQLCFDRGPALDQSKAVPHSQRAQVASARKGPKG